MAKILTGNYVKPSRRKRPGIHSKTKASNLKGSKNFLKQYKGQGR